MDTIVDIKYQSIMKKYQEVFPPYGIPEPGSAVFNHREALVLSYNIYLTNPNEFREILLRLFDEFDAALALIDLSVFRG
jgi:hypothetical protein